MTDTLPGLGGTLIDRMGIEILHASAERTTGTMPVAGNTQPYGLLHGGASAVLAETLGSVAAMHHAGPDRAAVGIELNVTHHRSARDGLVHGEAVAISLGRTLASYAITITDDDGRRICTGRLTCLVIAEPPA
ncbi:thioesterase superfamily protein [Xylanimonas cellulosilytica DSM 15894]|uniref:Thioesterase superfamily protein n=1 Tax=Xylanimonas cellulosilytica (strain DSM 15894 / JCM 12276 / CECT 5975 / KCTC 9989 / LMG 20990 / NBRC 107835 / XIL07) TaxID=446471 RepID=D1BS46_XYLCX|nr:PaaI family thioesterase [Xylanimonas cellulosilytica]ACZ30538.1 thioesterase superfamily protein [Xylanimonas cellulosilytica DSM 15894]